MQVHIVGTGLIGASIGMALTRAGVRVTLTDASPTAAALARDLGAGEQVTDVAPEADVVVVATPPDVTAASVLRALEDHPRATVTDVASVKASVLETLLAEGGEVALDYVAVDLLECRGLPLRVAVLVDDLGADPLDEVALTQ